MVSARHQTQAAENSQTLFHQRWWQIDVYTRTVDCSLVAFPVDGKLMTNQLQYLREFGSVEAIRFVNVHQRRLNSQEADLNIEDVG